MHRFQGRAIVGASLCLALAACGGGGSSAKYDGSVLHGQVLMGYNTPISGATVCLYGLVNSGSLFSTGNPVVAASAPSNANPYVSSGVLISTTGDTYSNFTTAQLSPCLTTDASGNFTQSLTTYYGPVLIQVSGGVFTSAATGAVNPTTLNNITNRTSTLEAIANIGGGGTVSTVVTPLTTIATELATAYGGQDGVNYARGLSHVQAQFGITQDLTATPTSSASDPYQLALLGVQQYLVSYTTYGATAPGGDDPNGSYLLTWSSANLGTVSTDYTAAYNAVNGSSASFGFN